MYVSRDRTAPSSSTICSLVLLTLPQAIIYFSLLMFQEVLKLFHNGYFLAYQLYYNYITNHCRILQLAIYVAEKYQMLLFKLIILKRSTLAMASYNLTKLKGDQANIATIKLRIQSLSFSCQCFHQMVLLEYCLNFQSIYFAVLQILIQEVTSIT